MKKSGFYILILAGLLLGCNHDTDTFDGPALIDRFGEFTIKETLQASQGTVDFSTGETVFFTATFSKNIAWVIRITGQESGSVKFIEGFDSELNESNSSWNGTTTELPLFRAEDCEVALIIPEEDSLTTTVDVTVTGTREYEGNLIADFETDPGMSIEIGNFEFDFSSDTGIQDDITAAEGEKYFLLEGTDVVQGGPTFVGLIRIFPSINGETYFSVPTTITEELYFNYFLWEDGTPGTIAVFQFFTDTNDDGEFTDGVDQSYEIQPTTVIEDGGWRHVFPTMSQCNIPENEVDRIVAIQILLISTEGPDTETRYGLDFLTFTGGQPLNL